MNLDCKIRDPRSNTQYLIGSVRNHGTTSLERFQFGQYGNGINDSDFSKVCSRSLCQYFYKLLPQDISIMRPRVFNSLTRKIDLHIEFVDSLMIAFFQNKACFDKEKHSEKFNKFQPPDL